MPPEITVILVLMTLMLALRVSNAVAAQADARRREELARRIAELEAELRRNERDSKTYDAGCLGTLFTLGLLALTVWVSLSILAG